MVEGQKRSQGEKKKNNVWGTWVRPTVTGKINRRKKMGGVTRHLGGGQVKKKGNR